MKTVSSTSGSPILRKQNKNQDRIAACSKSRYSAYHRHAAGALIPLALPLGCAQPPSAGPRVLDVADVDCRRILLFSSPLPSVVLGWTTDPVCRGYDALRFPRTLLARFVGGLLVEGLLKFALIGEIFAHVFGPYESLAQARKDSDPRSRCRSGLRCCAGGCVLPPQDRPLRNRFRSRTFLSRRST